MPLIEFSKNIVPYCYEILLNKNFVTINNKIITTIIIKIC